VGVRVAFLGHQSERVRRQPANIGRKVAEAIDECRLHLVIPHRLQRAQGGDARDDRLLIGVFEQLQ
jgi:hypothetical protein